VREGHFTATHAMWCCDTKVESPKAPTDPAPVCPGSPSICTRVSLWA
jgi:hypothetical protein